MTYRKLFVGAMALIFLASCLKQPDFPPEPNISLNAFHTYPDSARLIINFTDGDGNFGLEDADTTGFFCPDCDYHNNLFCEYYELQNGIWVHIPLDPEFQIPFWYRVPWLKPTGQHKAQEGTIGLEMPFYYLASEFDTARFEVFIFDRDLKESNHIFTQAFLKPQ